MVKTMENNGINAFQFFNSRVHYVNDMTEEHMLHAGFRQFENYIDCVKTGIYKRSEIIGLLNEKA